MKPVEVLLFFYLSIRCYSVGPSESTKSLNVGAIPKDAADAIDELFHLICVMLKKRGREIIPKKMLYSAALFNWLHVNKELGRKEATDEAIAEFVNNIEKFWREHGGELKEGA